MISTLNVLMLCVGKKEESKSDMPVLQEESSGTSPYPVNDEFGVPMLELSSDSDTVRWHLLSICVKLVIKKL